MSDSSDELRFDRERVDALLAQLEVIAAGGTAHLPITAAGDELDAIAHAINVLADELRWTHDQMDEAQRRTEASLRRSKDIAERADEAKSVFLRTASHEIRTPIAAILGIVDLLAWGGMTETDHTSLVARLRANSRSLLSLVGNVLDLSRLEADKIAPALEPFSPVDLVTEVVASMEHDAVRKGLTLRAALEIDGSMLIDSDGLRLRQILVNLVANAIKFTQQGFVTVRARADKRDGLAELTIDVSDSGIGIDTAQRRHLFTPFGQADASIARTHGGTGLGLALSRRIAEQLGGTLSLLHSEPGQGTTFRLALAARVVENVGQGTTSGAESSASATGRVLDGVRVLLADDNDDLRFALGWTLKLEGASVADARDGHEAVSMFRSGNYDVVLMDLKMPGMSGLEATGVLRGEGCRVPIIALSADATPEGRAASIVAGCSAFLIKPFDSSDLVASIRFLRNDGPDPAATAQA